MKTVQLEKLKVTQERTLKHLNESKIELEGFRDENQKLKEIPPLLEKMIAENRMEKYILRKAFDGYLPDEILWRQKEQFSDGVGYSWIDGLKNFAENEVSDTMMSNAQKQFPVKTPTSKEEYVYRSIFKQYFPGESPLACIPTGPSIACSTPEAIVWEKSFAGSADPSGRSVTIHEQSY